MNRVTNVYMLIAPAILEGFLNEPVACADHRRCFRSLFSIVSSSTHKMFNVVFPSRSWHRGIFSLSKVINEIANVHGVRLKCKQIAFVFDIFLLIFSNLLFADFVVRNTYNRNTYGVFHYRLLL